MPERIPESTPQIAAPKRQLLLWDTEVRIDGDGAAKVVAMKPLVTCDTERALKVLGLPDTKGGRWTLYNLRRCNEIKGDKPGAVNKRKDGKKSTAKICWDMESLLIYKQQCREMDS